MSEATALYRHFDANGELLYVGISLGPIARLAAHARYSNWAADIVRVELEWLPTRDDALRAEIEAINSEKPKHNKAGFETNQKISRAAEKVNRREVISFQSTQETNSRQQKLKNLGFTRCPETLLRELEELQACGWLSIDGSKQYEKEKIDFLNSFPINAE